MPRATKPTPIEAFDANMGDAHQLVKLVEGFTNQRERRMRVELRRRIGEALRVPERKRPQLDCLESSDVFVTFLPGSRLSTADFTDARPLLRQSLVAACAATETYIADKVMKRVGPLLQRSSTLTPRLADLTVTLEDWMRIEKYQRKGWGLKEYVVEPYVREHSSTAPSQVGIMLSLVGVKNWAREVDARRDVKTGTTVAELKKITDRRNQIAHEGDRLSPSRRAELTIGEVKRDLARLEAIVAAIEVILG